MVSVPTSSAVDRVLKIRSGKTIYKQIGIYCSKFDLRYAIDTWIETQFLVGFVFLLIVVCHFVLFLLTIVLSVLPRFRDRPFNLKGTIQELEYFSSLSRKARNFFPEFNINVICKNSESDYLFFSSTKIKMFFSATLGIRIFFLEKNHLKYVPGFNSKPLVRPPMSLPTQYYQGSGIIVLSLYKSDDKREEMIILRVCLCLPLGAWWGESCSYFEFSGCRNV